MISHATFPRDYDGDKSAWYRFYRAMRLVERHAGARPLGADTRWLDLGCHSGSMPRALIALYGMDPVGADQYPEEHKTARQYECYQKTENPWTYHQRDVAVDFALEEKFDFISALEVIEHMVDTDGFLDRCRAQLKPGGRLLITTPNINNLRNRIRVPLGQYPIGLEHRTVIHHVRLYNVERMRSHLTERGFRVLGITGVNLLPDRLVKRSRLASAVSEALSNALPTLATNIVALAEKTAD